MPGPNFTFAFIVATLFGAGFHVVVGGDARRLTMYLLAGWIGFAMGQMAGNSLPGLTLTIGELHLLPAGAGALVALLLAYILSSGRARRRSPRAYSRPNKG
ncbi:MAG: hypothetical protein MUE40_16760 [Anaerolineae bacterium]|jgi:hypothetical protein|nr:hypothetical protein [Anaerolineae bacterium]